MTLHQGEAFALVACMLALFASGKMRYDMVAASMLSLAAILGVVSPEKAFEGFSNPVIIIIASVLVLGRAIAISGLIETALRLVLDRLKSQSMQIGILVSAVTFLSAIMKNVGALGIFIPIAEQAAERDGRSPSAYLMPLSFGSLIGGTITLVGTSPNLLISTVRQQVLGKPYQFFDFAWVGLPLSIMTIGFLSFGWRLLPKDRKAATAEDKQFALSDSFSEVTLPAGSPLIGKTVKDLEDLSDDTASVTAIIREGGRRYIPSRHWTLYEGDLLVLRADPMVLKPLLDRAKLELQDAVDLKQKSDTSEDIEEVEAIVTAESPMIGRNLRELALRRNYEVNLLAVTQADGMMHSRLAQTKFQIGDVVVLQGHKTNLPEILTRLGCLPLANRNIAIARKRPRWLSLIILVGTMIAIVTKIIPVAIAFFVAAILVILCRLLTAREAYQAVDWPIIIMLACLIPIGEGMRETGAADLVAQHLTIVAAMLPATFALGLVLVVSMLATPFLHHAAAVLVLGPIAAAIAHNLHYAVDPFLIAVALGAACDFLTPIGHQNNLLVMTPGGYKFGDYWRLGLPLTCLVAVVGTVLISTFWPLH